MGPGRRRRGAGAAAAALWAACCVLLPSCAILAHPNLVQQIEVDESFPEPRLLPATTLVEFGGGSFVLAWGGVIPSLVLGPTQTQGAFSGELWAYDVSGRRWDMKQTLEVFASAGAQLVSFPGPHGIAWLIGGSFGLPNGQGFETFRRANTLQTFNMSSGRWTAVAGGGISAAYHSATVVGDSCAVIFGGVAANGSSVVDTTALFDPVAVRFTQITRGAGVPWPEARWGHVAGALNGRAYVLTGCRDIACSALFSTLAAWVFSPADGCRSGSWSEVTFTASHPGEGSGLGFATGQFVPSTGRLFVFGGYGDSGNLADTITILDANQRTLSTHIGDGFNQLRRFDSTSVITAQNVIFILFGQTQLQVISENGLTAYSTELMAFIRSQLLSEPQPVVFSQLAELFPGTFILSGGLTLEQFTAPVWRFSTFGQDWNLLHDTTPPAIRGPITRFGHIFVGHLFHEHYMWGGDADDLDAAQFNTVWIFRFGGHGRSYSWEPARLKDPTQPLPARRAIPAYALMSLSDSRNRIFYVFGGFAATGLQILGHGVPLDTMWLFAGIFGTYRWEAIPKRAGRPWPPARAGSAFGVHQWQERDHLVMFGGRGAAAVLSDLWAFDLEREEWRELTMTQPQPAGRAYATFVSVGLHLMVMAGTQSALFDRFGLTTLGLNDTWIGGFDLGNGAADWGWQRIDVAPVSQTVGAVAATERGYALVEGGDEARNTALLFGGFAPALESATTGRAYGNIVGISGIASVELSCNAGQRGNWFNSTCSACPVGTYGEASGSACSPCPAGTSTASPGVSAQADCSVCAPGICASGGVCSVDFDFEVSCRCKPGYSGEFCTTNTALIFGLSAFGVVIFLAVAFVLFRLVRRMRVYRVDSKLKERLLLDRDIRLEEFEQIWQIDAQDVNFGLLLAQGAFGEVYKGEYQGHQVAIKRLKQQIRELDERAEMDFLQEVSTIRKLRHRNVVFFYGAGAVDNVPFLVTEFVGRGSLRTLLSESFGTLSWERKLAMTRDIASGMQYIHAQTPPLIHRDLKSGNLLVADNWTVKVADFGTTRAFESLQLGPGQQGGATSFSLASLTTGVGTLLWSSPEILNGEVYDQQADVYSFGIVLWELATGEIPYTHIHNAWDVRDSVIAGGRPPQPEGSLPAGYVALMTAAWGAAPAARPSFEECLTTLEGMAPPLLAAPQQAA